jgi:4-amino-4-deoxy-L-arabinose transferase-like glycosyltransferase
MKNKQQLIILGVILLASIFLRFTSVIESRDFWYDEAFTGILLKQDFSQMNQSIFDDVHPPLYYWLAKPWASLGDYSPLAIRSFSAFWGILTVLSLYWIGKKLFSERTGLLAAAISAFSPFAIEYSQEARMYSLFGFLMLWAVWFFIQGVKEDKIAYWISWGILSGLSFYTHYLALFFFVMFYLAYVVTKNKEKGNFFSKLFGGKNFWIGVGIIFIFFVSWSKILFSHIMKGNLGWIEPSYLSDILETLQIFFFGHPAGTGGMPWSNEFRYFFDGSSAGLIIFSVMLALFFANYKKSQQKKELKILAIMSFGTLIFLVILSHLNIKLYVARYFMPAAVLIYLLFSALVVEYSKNRFAWVMALAVYALFLISLEPLQYNSSWNNVYHFDKELPKKTLIITSNPFDYTSARYYFGEDRVKYYNKSNPTEDFSGWVVVGNENRLTSIKEVSNYRGSIIVDNTCQWAGLELQEEGSFGDLKICRIINQL